MHAVRLHRGLLAALAVGSVAAAMPGLAQQPAANQGPPTVSTQTNTPPPPWAQGRPDTPDVANLAPVAPPPIATLVDRLPLAKLKLPKGFNLEVYAAGLANARSLRVDDKGNVYVSTRLL